METELDMETGSATETELDMETGSDIETGPDVETKIRYGDSIRY